MFKVGDTVKCVNVNGMEKKLKIGNHYIVDRDVIHEGSDVLYKLFSVHEIGNDTTIVAFISRFELVKENNMAHSTHYEIEFNLDSTLTHNNWVPVPTLGKILEHDSLDKADRVKYYLTNILYWPKSNLRIVVVEKRFTVTRTPL